MGAAETETMNDINYPGMKEYKLSLVSLLKEKWLAQLKLD